MGTPAALEIIEQNYYSILPMCLHLFAFLRLFALPIETVIPPQSASRSMRN